MNAGLVFTMARFSGMTLDGVGMVGVLLMVAREDMFVISENDSGLGEARN
jgi:hypothetical protein